MLQEVGCKINLGWKSSCSTHREHNAYIYMFVTNERRFNRPMSANGTRDEHNEALV